MTSSPTFACSRLISSSCLRCPWPLPLLNVSFIPSSASRFHLAIMFGCTLYRAASSATVPSPRIAASANQLVQQGLEEVLQHGALPAVQLDLAVDGVEDGDDFALFINSRHWHQQFGKASTRKVGDGGLVTCTLVNLAMTKANL